MKAQTTQEKEEIGITLDVPKTEEELIAQEEKKEERKNEKGNKKKQRKQTGLVECIPTRKRKKVG